MEKHHIWIVVFVGLFALAVCAGTRLETAAQESTVTCAFRPPYFNGIVANLQGFTFDGHYFWATVETTDHPRGQIPDGKILKLDPNTFELLAEFNHPSTAIDGITYNPTRDVFVTSAALGGPRYAPWEGGQSFYFIHDPDTFEILEQFPGPSGNNGIVYYEPTDTYFTVEVVDGRLNEHRSNDFRIIHSYQLPGAPHHPKGITLIPNQDGPPFILVHYYNDPSGPQDESGRNIEILQIVNDHLLLLGTVRSNDGYVFGIGDMAWVDSLQRLVTVGPPRRAARHDDLMIFIHDEALGCYPLPGIPPQAPCTAIVNANANVRAAPSTAAALVGTTATGQVVQVTGQTATGDWFQIHWDDQPAWIADFLIGDITCPSGAAVEVVPETR